MGAKSKQMNEQKQLVEQTQKAFEQEFGRFAHL